MGKGGAITVLLVVLYVYIMVGRYNVLTRYQYGRDFSREC